jgi:site-specific DNA recombinase
MHNPWEALDNRAVALVRVSSHRQKDNTSHETQEKEIREYCDSKGLDLVDVVRITESAKDSETRVQYMRAMDDVRRRKILHIIFYMYDRETRNLTDNERNENLVKEGKLVIHYAREGKALFRGSPDSDFFMRDISAVTNKHFTRNLRAKMKDAMRQKAESGWFPGNHPPLGYVHKRRIDDEGKEIKRGTIIVPDPDPKKVRQVQREFELRAEGHSYSVIKEKIVSEGFIPAYRLYQYREAAIERRLKNPFYAGRIIWDGKEYKGKHELIIPPDLLERVQESFMGSRRATRVADEFTSFAGTFRCVECGCAIVYDPKRKVIQSTGQIKMFHYYHCANTRGGHTSLKGMNVTYEEIWRQCDSIVQAVAIPAALASEVAHALNAEHSKDYHEARRLLDACRASQSALEAKEDAAYDNLESGILDELGYRRQIQRLREQRAELRKTEEHLQRALKGAYRMTAETILELATRAETLWKTRKPSERRAFIEKLCSNQGLRGKVLEFQLRRPFKILNQMKLGGWRPHVDEFRTYCLGLSSANLLESLPKLQGETSNHGDDWHH